MMKKGEDDGTEGEEQGSWAQWCILAAVCAGTGLAQEEITVFSQYPSCGATAHLGLQQNLQV